MATREYTDGEWREALLTSPRVERYRCELLNHYLIRTGELPMTSMRIDCDAGSQIPTSFSGELAIDAAAPIDWAGARLRPVMELQMPDGGYGRKVLGTFVPTSPAYRYGSRSGMVSIGGYDITVLMKEDKFEDSVLIEAKTGYQSAVTAMIQQAGIQRVLFDQSDAVLASDMVFEMGTARLDAVNTLLKAIGYQSAYATEEGAVRCRVNTLPYARAMDHRYEDSALSVLRPELTVDRDTFDVPNVIIATVSVPDGEPLAARWENTDPGSALSILRRGRKVVRIDELTDIEDQEGLTAYVRAEGYKVMAGSETIDFKTAAMPGHGVNDVVYLKSGDAGLLGRYQEVKWSLTLSPGSEMTHTAEKVVLL